MVSPVFLNMRSALRLACLEALTTKFIHGAAGLIVTTLLLIGANLLSTLVTHSVSEKDVMVSLIAFSESESEVLKIEVSIALILRLLTVCVKLTLC